MVEKNKLDEDLQGTPVDATLYRGMIGSFMYLTSSRPNLIYAVCLCARYQEKPTEKHLNAFNKIPLYCDNKSAIALCCNNVQHSRAKHIDVLYHFIKEHVENGIVELYFVRTEYQLADIFTKPLARKRFNFLIEKLGMRSINMNPVAAKQVALSNSLVPSEKRLKIEKCNARIEFSKPQREETYQGMHIKKNVNYVSLLWEDFIYQADNREISSTRKEHIRYPKFTKVIISHFISKDKTISTRNKINLHTICDDTLLGTLKFVSKTQDYQQYGALIPDDMINQDIKDSKAYKTYYDFATGKATPKKARKYKKVASPLIKLSHVLEEELAVKPKQAKKPAKKSTTVPTTGVAIRDTPSESVPKKKTPAKVDRGKGMDLHSDVALLKAAQLKKTLKKSKLETHTLHASGLGDGVGSQPKVPNEQEDKTTGTDEGTGTIPGVLDVPKYLSESENESWGDSGDDESNDDDSDEVTKDDDEDDVESDADDDKEASDSGKTDSDEVRILISIRMTMKKKNIKKNTEHEEQGKEDEEMTDAGCDDSTQHTKYEQVKDDEHETLTTINDTQKTEGPMQSSSVSFDFTNQFINLDKVPPTDTEVVSMMNVKVRHEEPSTQTPPPLNIPVTVISKTSTSAGSTIPLTIPPITPLQKQSTPTPTPAPTTTTTTTSIPALLDFSSLFGFSTYEAATSLIEFELKKILLDKIQKSKLYRGAQEHKDLYDVLVKSYKLDKDLLESYGKVYSLKRDREDKDKDEDPPARSDQGLKKQKTSKDAEPSRGSKSKEYKSNSSKGSKSQSKSSGKSAQAEEPAALKDDWFNKPKRHPTSVLDWNTTKSINFRPPQTWISKIAKAGKPPLTFDELMSTPIDFYEYVMNNLKIENLTQEQIVGTRVSLRRMQSKHDAFSTKRIIAATHVKAMKLYDYGYLEEIIVRRGDQQLYKFKEGDFPRINLRDIKDLLLLLVQKKLSNMEEDVIFELNVTLRMFTKCIVILKRVEDLQLGVESYQKKLNITRPETFRFDITKMTPYTAYNNPQGIIYQDKFKRNSLEMDYLPKRRWSKLDRKRSRIMIKAIDQQLFKRRLMRNLEKFAGGREYGKDFRLLERTI
ncbi:hypothetical protein Tco_0894716 [Tanacetum coccineum]|uniref:Uncharacterized protein n=1 Tax=Tanacetum coccineum TaxID=301880 RepID=A0ABQ5CIU0_9ASTR